MKPLSSCTLFLFNAILLGEADEFHGVDYFVFPFRLELYKDDSLQYCSEKGSFFAFSLQ